MNLFILCLTLVCTVSAMNTPDGYVFDVQPVCSKTKDGRTRIHVLTDLDVHVEGECKDSYIAQFDTTNYVDWYLYSFYQGNSLFDCLFTKKNGSNTYILYLSVSWAVPGEVMLNHDVYMITCVLDDHGTTKSNVKSVEKGLLGPREIQSHMGGEATSDFILKLTDIRGDALPKTVSLGRKVQLTAEMLVSKEAGAENEIGIRAINCAAIGGGSSYKILRGGCGDGLVLPRDVGFKTTGVISKSPIFTAFRLARSQSVSFSCNFTTCTTECDGDSCIVETRRRRDLRHEYTEPETFVTIPLQLHVHVRSVDDAGLQVKYVAGTELQMKNIDDTGLQARSAEIEPDGFEVDPCSIPGVNLEGCYTVVKPAKRDFPVSVASLMMVVMVVFPMLLVIGMAAFFCCPKTESYGINDGTKSGTI